MLLPECIHRSIRFFQNAGGRIFDDLRPRLIRLTERDGIGVARTAIEAERLGWRLGS